MEEESLAISFSDSLTEEVSDFVGEFIEIGIDSMMDDGLTKDIPFLSTFTSIYKIGKTIRERHHLKKLAVFLNEINQGAANKEQRKSYREKFATKGKYRDSELEYVTIVLDHYIDFDKPGILAKLYLAYLDGMIDWIEFKKYAEVIDRFLPGDATILINTAGDYLPADQNTIDSVLRLLSMGVVSQNVGVEVTDDGEGAISLMNAEGYRFTLFGNKLKLIIRNYIS